jgi:ubiquinone/menaquinone biosynthesis C-methylase UbiE
VEQANREAAHRGLSARIRFQQADAEFLPFPDASFDVVVCECAFCTFPEKLASRESLPGFFARN